MKKFIIGKKKELKTSSLFFFLVKKQNVYIQTFNKTIKLSIEI